MPEKINRDAVRHPKHYELPGLDGVEAIDVIKSALGPEKFVGFCQGNALKYLIRAGKKDGESRTQDFQKAQVYCGWAAKESKHIWDMVLSVIDEAGEEVEENE